MSNKRKSPSVDEFELADPKRHCSSPIDPDDEAPSRVSQPRVDPTYGQRGAFPGLDDSPSDDALFYGPASDGLEYLRMVRSEARTVPNLLVAKSSAAPKAADLYSDYQQGYYADGAYTAAPVPAVDDSVRNGYDDEDEEDCQEAYYTALRARFRSFSSLLEHSPPSNLISPSASNTAQMLSTGMKSKWRSAFGTMPTMTVLGQLPQESVLLGLQVLESNLANGNIAKKEYLSLWAWGLLARCREAGQMGSEEIGILRDLGKRAVWLLRGLRAGTQYLTEEQAQDIDNSDEGSDNGKEDEELDARDSPPRAQEHQGLETTTSIPPADSILAESEIVSSHETDNQPDVGDPLAAAKVSLLSSLAPEPPAPTSSSLTEDTTQPLANGHSTTSATTSAEQPAAEQQRGQAIRLYATLDMIVTIVGEFYGQRDLLDGRLVWGEIDLGNF